MFVGHYAPVFALAAARGAPGLGTGFIAVQLIDIGFMSLSYFGIEKWRANPSIEGFMPIDLYYMPYTHSLAGTAVWAAAFALVVAAFTPAGQRGLSALIAGALVLSHWFLDLIVHRSDLPLVHDTGEKLGYALWDQPLIEAPLELGLLFAGFWLFMAATKPRGTMGKVVPWLVMTVLLVVQGINWFTPPAPDGATFAGLGLTAYLGLAALALWLDRTRVSASHPAFTPFPERLA
jgi:hypothetical protein